MRHGARGSDRRALWQRRLAAAVNLARPTSRCTPPRLPRAHVLIPSSRHGCACYAGASMPSDERSTILIVDDKDANLLALEAVLEPLQQRLLMARSGREALRFLLQEDPAVILLDVNMPELDGFETAALIRERERSRYTPIIFVTAVRREEEHILKGYASGAIDYVVKPFAPETMLAKVHFFLELHQRDQALRREAQQRREERDEFERREQMARAGADAHREHLYALF